MIFKVQKFNFYTIIKIEFYNKYKYIYIKYIYIYIKHI